ncbi:histone H3-K79 methyltransferase [Lecanosticta acicola]|uniref:Histone-lysine N-methyltransferase, H3 lysine-79 specific n=1 Tax=Lecanosticta acicola TaxID=111012 RepID=A0AAI8Z6V7_9PEZI|nr:histone H3-K79 methyltransferase [Lecanosticta acicola]
MNKVSKRRSKKPPGTRTRTSSRILQHILEQQLQTNPLPRAFRVTNPFFTSLSGAGSPQFEASTNTSHHTHPVLANKRIVHLREQAMLQKMMPDTYPLHGHPLHGYPLHGLHGETQSIPQPRSRPQPFQIDVPLHLRTDLISLQFRLINSLHHSAASAEALDDLDPAAWTVELRYPSGYSERFRLDPKSKLTKHARARTLEPIDDVLRTVDMVLQLAGATDELRRLLRLRLTTSWENKAPGNFKPALATVNSLLDEKVQSGNIQPQVTGRFAPEFLDHFFDQLYDRAASPHVHVLKSGKGEHAYGELRPAFLSRIFRLLGLRADSIYFDMGSGIGNTAMQAALEIGCEAQGMELASQPHLLGNWHLQQFNARCALWDLQPGRVELHYGNFLRSDYVAALLPDVDAVLVNNVKYAPDTDLGIYELLVKKLKVGAKVFSMRPLTPMARGGLAGGGSKAVTGDGVFQVEEFQYEQGAVTWTDNGGIFHISTKLRARV